MYRNHTLSCITALKTHRNVPQKPSVDSSTGYQLYASSTKTSALLCNTAAHRLALPPGFVTVLLWMKGCQAQNTHFCLQTVYNIPVEKWSVFNWLCIWLLVLFIQRPCSGKSWADMKKWDRFVKSTHNHGMWWRQSSVKPELQHSKKCHLFE